MNIEQVKEIANAVLYEGYLLYPYRQSAIKNRQRWTIGVVYPREYSEANGGVEPWAMQTECLVTGQESTTLDLFVRFLHLLVRTVKQPEATDDDASGQERPPHAGEWSIASHFADEPREEGVEREIGTTGLSLRELVEHTRSIDFTFPCERIVEKLVDGESSEAVLEHQQLKGTITIAAARVDADLFKLSMQIENHTPETRAITNRRNAILLHSFISAHTILRVHQGAFISLIDPPEALGEAARGCKNIRTWPVLVGSEGDFTSMLSSPIILYDYPRIAPESPGSLFDGTEIDEILTLRIMTLTDEEKEEMRKGDLRVREILERTEHLTPEALMKLHGTIRTMKPVAEEET
jgi:hydrogenase maturation protease